MGTVPHCRNTLRGGEEGGGGGVGEGGGGGGGGLGVGGGEGGGGEFRGENLGFICQRFCSSIYFGVSPQSCSVG